jgi:O-antigen/teichoic acid export membrane protein
MSAPATVSAKVGSLAPPPIRRTVANLASVGVGEALLRVAGLGVALMIAREYGAGMFGHYATAVATATCVVTVADNGLNLATVQRIRSRGAEADAEFSRLLTTKIWASALAVILLLLTAAAARPAAVVWALWALVASRTVLHSLAQMNFSALKAFQVMTPIGLTQGAHFLFLATGILLAYQAHAAVTVLLGIVVACQAGELVGSSLWLRRLGVRLRSASLRDCASVLRNSLPLGLTASIAAAVLRWDVICLSLFATKSVVGEFAAAQFVLIGLYVGSWLFGSVVLSDMTRLAPDKAALDAYVAQWTRRLAWATVPVTAIAVWVVPQVIPQVFGSGFASAGPIARVFLLFTPVVFFNSLFLNRAIALRQQSIYTGVYGTTMAVSVALALLLTLGYGLPGIVVAALFREAALFVVLRNVPAGGAA